MADAKQTPKSRGTGPRSAGEVEAYKKFKQKTRKIVHDFRKEAAGLIEKIDDKQEEAIKKKISEHRASF